MQLSVIKLITLKLQEVVSDNQGIHDMIHITLITTFPIKILTKFDEGKVKFDPRASSFSVH